MRSPRCVGEHDAKGRMADKGDHDGDAARARAVAGGSGGRRHVTPRDVRSRSSRHRQVQVPGGCRAGRGLPIRRGGGTADPPWARGRSAVGRRQAAAAGWSAPDGRPHSSGPPCGHSSPAAYQWQCVVARPRFPPLLPPRSTHPAAVFFLFLPHTDALWVPTYSLILRLLPRLPRPLKQRAHLPKRTAVPRPALPRRAAASGCHPRTNPPDRHGPPVVAWGVAARPSTRARGGSPHRLAAASLWPPVAIKGVSSRRDTHARAS